MDAAVFDLGSRPWGIDRSQRTVGLWIDQERAAVLTSCTIGDLLDRLRFLFNLLTRALLLHRGPWNLRAVREHCGDDLLSINAINDEKLHRKSSTSLRLSHLVACNLSLTPRSICNYENILLLSFVLIWNQEGLSVLLPPICWAYDWVWAAIRLVDWLDYHCVVRLCRFECRHQSLLRLCLNDGWPVLW